MHIRIRSGARILEHTSRSTDIQVARIQASIVTEASILYDEEGANDIYLFNHYNRIWAVSQKDAEVIS